MKRHIKRLIACALVVVMGITLLPAREMTAGAAETSGITFTDAKYVRVSNYGTDRTSVINDNWKFYLGNSAAAMEENFNDSSWETIDLPHDFSITQKFTTAGEAESGFLPGGTGWYRKKFILPSSCSGKSIVLNFDGVYSLADVYINGKKIGENRYGYTPFSFDITDQTVCDGETENVIAVQAVNDIPSSRWYSGSGIYRDVKLIITDPVHIALNGTYITTPNLADSNGTDGTVKIAVDVQNDSMATANVIVKNTVYEKNSTDVLTTVEAEVSVAAGQTEKEEMQVLVNNPKLWSTDSPNLYVAKTEIIKDSQVVDACETEFGFKWYEFAANEGFKLNGQNMKIYGVCMHHDQGALGAVASYDAMYRQLTKMKEMGVNTIRISHNPGDEDFIDICNEMGFLVIQDIFDGWGAKKNGNSNDFSAYFSAALDESNHVLGGGSSMTWAEFVLKSVMKRDRNDASMLLWSLGNELQEGTSGGASWNWGQSVREMMVWAAEADSSHLLTSGANNRGVSLDDWNSAVVNKILYDNGNVAGINYGDDNSMETLHNTYSVFLHSESVSAINSRGIYMGTASQANIDGKGHLTSYDTSCVGWGSTAHDSIWRVMTRDWIAGECVWTGFDYIGEPTPYNGTGAGASSSGLGAAPNSSYFGIVDTSGFEKDNFYLYRSQWNHNANTLHLVTAWDSDNMIDNNGKTPVWVYSNAPKVELYCNGNKIGTATRRVNTTAAGHIYYTYTTESNDSSICQTSSGSGSTSLYSIFNVEYVKGTLSARAFDIYGNEITSACEGKKTVSTPGNPAKLEISQDKTEIMADGSSLVYVSVDVTDENGNLDTTADAKIQFTLEGEGEIVGVDNGDQATTDKFQQPSVIGSKKSAHIKAYAGKALVIARSTENAGNFTITISADGLEGGTAMVKTKQTVSNGKKALTGYRLSEHCYVPAGEKELVLPKTLQVSYSDGTEGVLPIHWKDYDKSSLSKAGSFTVTGSIQDGENKISFSMNVHVYDPIVSVGGYANITRPGVMPNLPGALMTYYADGSAFEEFPAVWDMTGITEQSFASAGTVVRIPGAVNALGNTYKAAAFIRVAAPVPGEVENKALDALHLTADQKYNDNLHSIIDGTRADNGTSGSRWSTWDKKGDNTAYSAVITMDWATVISANTINLFFFRQAGGGQAAEVIPENVRFEYTKSSNWDEKNGMIVSDEWIELPYQTPTQITDFESTSTVGYRYVLNEDINPIAIRITMSCSAGNYVGLNEAEIMGTSYSYPANTSADPGNITIGGTKVDVADGQTAVVDVDLLENIVLSNETNAMVTMIPNGNGGMTILTTSEDGSNTQTRYIVLKNPVDAATKKAALQKVADVKAINAEDYTVESYQALMNAAERLEKSIGIISKRKFEEYLTALNNAQAGLKLKKQSVAPTPISIPELEPQPEQKPELRAGQITDFNKMTFKVINAAAKTVELVRGQNRKAANVIIPATVPVNGVDCRVVKVAANAFKGYSKLKTVIIGKNVTAIKKKAFFGCKKLKKVTFKGTAIKNIKNSAFKNTSKKMTVKVTKSLKKNTKKLAAFKKKLIRSGMTKKLKVK